MQDAPPLIIGSGIAGLWTAWRLAAEGRAARLVTKETLADSASAWAQGGIAVALGPGDNPRQHAADTLAAGDGLSDPEAVSSDSERLMDAAAYKSLAKLGSERR